MKYLGEFVFEGKVKFGELPIDYQHYTGLDIILADDTILHIIRKDSSQKIYLKTNKTYSIHGEVFYDIEIKELFLNLLTCNSRFATEGDITSKQEPIFH